MSVGVGSIIMCRDHHWCQIWTEGLVEQQLVLHSQDLTLKANTCIWNAQHIWVHACHHGALGTPSLSNVTLYRCLLRCHQKMAFLVLVCMGEFPNALSIIYFYVVECASCTKVLNKSIEIFCMHTSYVASVIQKMARLSWKYCTPPEFVDVDM